MRELKTKDIFKMSKILKKMDLNIDTKDKTEKQVGAELIKNVFENLHLAEQEVNEFFADLTNMTVEEFKELSIVESVKIINEFKNIPGIVDFFKQASK